MHMQTLFHDQKRKHPLCKENLRHPEDMVEPLMLYYMAETGQEVYERKGIRHDYKHWQERGNPQVSISYLIPLIFCVSRDVVRNLIAAPAT